MNDDTRCPHGVVGVCAYCFAAARKTQAETPASGPLLDFLLRHKVKVSPATAARYQQNIDTAVNDCSGATLVTLWPGLLHRKEDPNGKP